jgi:hypothetical protein
MPRDFANVVVILWIWADRTGLSVVDSVLSTLRNYHIEPWSKHILSWPAIVSIGEGLIFIKPRRVQYSRATFLGHPLGYATPGISPWLYCFRCASGMRRICGGLKTHSSSVLGEHIAARRLFADYSLPDRTKDLRRTVRVNLGHNHAN